MIKTTDDALDALDEIAAYFDNKSDADHDGERFVPNQEMRLLIEARDVINFLLSKANEAGDERGDVK